MKIRTTHESDLEAIIRIHTDAVLDTAASHRLAEKVGMRQVRLPEEVGYKSDRCLGVAICEYRCHDRGQREPEFCSRFEAQEP